MNKDSENKLLISSSIWYTFSGFASKGIVFLMLPFYVRLLTKAEYGDFSNFLSWLLLFSNVLFMNLNLHVIKEINDRHDDYNKIIINTYYAALSVALVVIIPILLFNSHFQALTKMSPFQVTLLVLYLLLIPLFDLCTAGFRARFQLKAYVVANLLVAVVTAALSITLLLLFSQSRLKAFTFGQVIPGMLFGFCYLLVLLKNDWRPLRLEIKKALSRGIPMLPHLLGVILLSQIDRIMIRRMVDLEAVANYALALNVSIILTTLSNSLNHAFVPWLNKQLKKGDEESIRKPASIQIMVFSLLIIFVILVAPELILLWGGKSYEESIMLLPPVLVSVACTHIYTLYLNIEYYMESRRVIALGTAIAALFNIVTNAVFIQLFGYQAAAYTTLASNLLLMLLHYLAVRRLKKEYLISSKVAWGSIAVLLILVFPALILYQHSLLRYGLIGLFMLVSACFVYRQRAVIWGFLHGKKTL